MAKLNRMVTLDIELWAEAKRRGINVSEACEAGLAWSMSDKKYQESRLAMAAELLKGDDLETAIRLMEKGKDNHLRNFVRGKTGITLTPLELKKLMQTHPS